MDIDDIFFAAVNGEKEKLIELLEADEIDINQYLTTDVGGERVSVFLLFSVISKMLEVGFNYEILDILIWYGADVDQQVIVETDAYTRKIPILNYSIADWRSLELTEYLLKKGADPNAIRTEDYGRSYTEMYYPLFFAMRISSEEFVKMLLYYGADPNRCVSTYNHEVACQQILPLLFYATNNSMIGEKTYMDSVSHELTYWMLGYGADIYITTIPYINDTGNRERRDRYRFIDYLRLEYNGYASAIYDSWKKLGDQRFVSVRVDKNACIKPEKRVQPVGMNNATPVSNPSPATDVNTTNTPGNNATQISSVENETEKIEKELFDYYWKHNIDFSIYRSWSNMKPVSKLLLFASLFFVLCTVGWYLIAKTIEAIFLVPALILLAIYVGIFIKRKKEANTYRKRTENLDSGWLRVCGKYAKAVGNSKDNQRYWFLSDLAQLDTLPETTMVYAPAERTSVTRDTVVLANILTTEESTTGESLEKLASDTEHFNVIHKERLQPDETYNIAELCFWRVTDGTILHQHTENRYSEEDIKRKMSEYESKLDGQEEFRNIWNSNNAYTDKEMFLYNKLDYWDYSLRDDNRSIKLYNYEDKLRSQTKTVYEGEDINVYKQYFRPAGIIAFDKNNVVVAVYLYNEGKITEYYKTDYEKRIFEISQLNENRDLQKDRMDAIRNLKYYTLNPISPSAPKPGYLTDEEWQMLIFVSHHPQSEKDTIAARVRGSYGDASRAKQTKVNKAQLGW